MRWPDRLRYLCASLLVAAAIAYPSIGAAQDDSPTPSPTATASRRPTPIPTATRTMSPTPSATVPPTATAPASATPTAFPPDEDIYFCSGGANDGQECAFDEDCPNGVCVLTTGVCDGGANDGDQCSAPSDCGGSNCLLTQKVCAGGELQGFACLHDAQCGAGVLCTATGLICSGGPYDSQSCVFDTDCADSTDPTNSGICVSQDVFLCSAPGNSQDGASCFDHSQCPGGACVLAQKVCLGGDSDGDGCEADIQCGIGTCVASQKVCNAGDFKGFGCLNDEQCTGGGTCVSPGFYCDGGDFSDFNVACTNNDDCTATGFVAGMCVQPVAQPMRCSAGTNDGQDCQSNTDCPGGGRCVLTQGVCDGGSNDAGFCDSNADCGDATCKPAHRVCGAGDFIGASCLNDNQCVGSTASGPCISSGRICVGGPVEDFSCVQDLDCYDPDFPPPGACEGDVPRSCIITAPCPLDGRDEQVTSSPDAPSPPATVDYYVSSIPPDAAGVIVALRMDGGDADLYVGQTVSDNIDDYAFASESSGSLAEEVRITPSTDPTFAAFTTNLSNIAMTVIGFDGAPTYTLNAIYLGNSQPGDADCVDGVNSADANGLIRALFDILAPLNNGPLPRCLGADANGDGRESVADLIGIATIIGNPS